MPDTESTRRLRRLLWCLILWAIIIVLRLGWLQIFKHQDFVNLARRSQQRIMSIPAPRGTIFDRTGKPLAISVPVENVIVNPLKIPDPSVAVGLLGPLLDLNRGELKKLITEAKLKESGFLRVKRKVSLTETAKLRTLKLDWLSFEKDTLRSYPHETLAAHVLGASGLVFTTGPDKDIERGTAGLELSLEKTLTGQPGKRLVHVDAKGNPYSTEEIQQPAPGTDVTITIDPALQHDVEVAIKAAVLKSNARSGSVVVLDPKNGEVLALANYPTYDPNVSPKGKDATERINRAIGEPFEPGSVFKTVTLSAGIETKTVTPETMINCMNGRISIGGRTVSDTHAYGVLSAADVLAKSSNVGAIQIGMDIGRPRMNEFVHRFGFGARTGIELPGESKGRVRREKDWTLSTLASVSMGHEVMTTSIQLAVAGSVIANGGLKVKPHLVLSTAKTNGGGQNAAALERVLEPETAISMRRMMEGVVLHGTGKLAVVRGYTSGGKTGSAQIYDPHLKVYTHTYNASFMGFAPVNDPQIVIAVTVVGTSNGNAGFGGPVAAPVFREVAASALRIRDVPKDPKINTSGNDAPKVYDDLPLAGLSHGPAPDEEEDAESVTAAVGSLQSLTPFVSSGPTRGAGIVPDLRGLPLRSVMEQSTAAGIPVDIVGDEFGYARLQDPQPGSYLRAGGRLRVRLAR